MVRKIAHMDISRPFTEEARFLRAYCEECTHEEGLAIARDLIDTARDNNDFSHKKSPCWVCNGLSANQIGYDKRVFIIRLPRGSWLPIINPRRRLRFLKGSDAKHMSKEMCLSTGRVSNVLRYNAISLEFLSWSGRKIIRNFYGGLADQVQHELDHLNGVY